MSSFPGEGIGSQPLHERSVCCCACVGVLHASYVRTSARMRKKADGTVKALMQLPEAATEQTALKQMHELCGMFWQGIASEGVVEGSPVAHGHANR